MMQSGSIFRSPGRQRLSVVMLMLLCTACESIHQNSRGYDPGAEQHTGSAAGDAGYVEEQAAVPVPYIDEWFYIEGQLCQHVRRIHEDRRGTYWFGSNVYGLLCYAGDSLEYLKTIAGEKIGRVTGIVEDSTGNVWFGAYAGLFCFDGQTFTHFGEADGLVDNEIWSLFLDSHGMLWVGTMEGVSRFDGKSFQTFAVPIADMEDPDISLSARRITSILEDKKGQMWFAIDGQGITVYDGKGFRHITAADGLPDNSVTHLLEDRSGNIWIGSMFGGISRFDGRGYTNFTQDGTVDGIEVWSVYEDRAGDIWFPAENVGVYRFNGSTFTLYDKSDGLNTNAIQTIYEDATGDFWLGGGGGLFRLMGDRFVSVTREGPW